VVESPSASHALEQIGAGLSPDLLVTDHMMPGMTGAALARQVRIGLPNLPVLMITGYANLRPEETRGFEVLAKPFPSGVLATRIAELLKLPGGLAVV
jgi:CheY-like chemotaxis protein